MSPAAQHQVGIHEAAVKSAKHHIKRVIAVILTKTEAILNSRPRVSKSGNKLEDLIGSTKDKDDKMKKSSIYSTKCNVCGCTMYILWSNKKIV